MTGFSKSLVSIMVILSAGVAAAADRTVLVEYFTSDG